MNSDDRDPHLNARACDAAQAGKVSKKKSKKDKKRQENSPLRLKDPGSEEFPATPSSSVEESLDDRIPGPSNNSRNP